MKNRREILAQAIDECVSEMYELSQPPGNIKEMTELAKKGLEDKNNPFYTQHYLPQQIYTEILESYMDAYRIRSEWHDDVDIVIGYLKNGGLYETYENEKRTTKKTQKLEELIGKEHADIVFDLIDKCKYYYRFNSDEQTFRFNVCLGSSPTSNKESVEKYWTEKTGEPCRIEDRKDWKEVFCYPTCPDEEEED